MCGIAGFIIPREKAQPAALHRMIGALEHRGPDDRGARTFQAGEWTVALGATRLAILDLSPAGHQPMEAGGKWIVYNGEIYNHEELRAELGGEWKSKTDTEVVLKGYARWGKAGLHRLRGMFALGLWDGDRKELILARDPFGIKPLYFWTAGDRLVFASEVRAVLKSGLVPRRLSPEGLGSYLSFGYVGAPLATIRDLRSLAPGHLLRAHFEPGAIRTRIEPFAHFPFPPESGFPGGKEAIPRLFHSLEESVRLHLISDVPVGAFLSGGVDSSAVVALMSRASPEKPRTFTVAFPERKYSEAAYARQVAEAFQTEHTEVLVTERDLLALLPGWLRSMDQPTIDGLNTFAVSRAVRRAGIKVALSGLGGDELFGGYPSFSRARLASRLRAVPLAWRKRAADFFPQRFIRTRRMEKALDLMASEMGPREVFILSRQLFGPPERKALCPALPEMGHPLPPLPPDAGPSLSISLCEMSHYLPNMLLRDTDSMSMAHGLEVRVPFVDREVVGTALAISATRQMARPKALLLEALGGLLPETIRRRPKMGFHLPLERWMQGGLAQEMEGTLSAGEFFRPLGLEPEAVLRVWQGFRRAPRRVGWARPWGLFVLARWSALQEVAL